MKKVILFGGFLAALLCLPVAAYGQFSDDFESYLAGAPLTTQSGKWDIWYSGGLDATVSTDYNHTPMGKNSALIIPSTDIVSVGTSVSGGKYTFEGWAYIPTGFVGNSYWIMCCIYPASVSSDWTVQSWFQDDGMFHGNCGSFEDVMQPYNLGGWNKIRTFIDFDNDWCQIFVNDKLMDASDVADHPTLGGGYQWSMNIWGTGGSILSLEVLDLYANTGTACYWDDVVLDVMNPWVDIKCQGLDDNVPTITQGTNVKLDFNLVSGIVGDGMTQYDVHIIVKRGAGYYSYDENGPLFGWTPGTMNAYRTEVLGNYFGTALDYALPAGTYTAYILIDKQPDGKIVNTSEILFIPGVGPVLDSVTFTVQ
jgi:hypothetical protein